MRLLRPALALFLFTIFYSGLQAQERCATVEYQKLNRVTGKVSETDAHFEKALAELIKARKNNPLRRLEGSYQIPVVVHVIHNGESIGTGRNIPDAQIISQIDVLNADFNRQNADAVNTPPEFESVAGNLDIEFVLAKQDPNGNCTNGIVRVDGDRDQWSMSREAEFKTLSYWPAEDYLNIWVIKFSGYLGYAQFPVSSGLPGLEDENDNRLTDGVILDYRVFGSDDAGPFDLDDQYNKGRSTTHEVGHFLGLRHIWGDEDGCAGSDYVDDTPNQEDETYNCPSNPQTDCGSNKMFQNYMDYTDDVCMNLFTQHQIERMIVVLGNSPRRASLLVSHGLNEPSQDLVDLELASVDFPSEITCANNRVNKTPLTITVNNNSGSDIDEISYTISINQAPATWHQAPVIFIDDEAVFSVTSLPGLRIGTNTVTVGVWAGCDPNPANNIASIQVGLLDDTCQPFVIYAQQSGQTAITFDLSEPAFTRVSVINLLGQEIARLDNPETINQTFPLSVLSGVYIVRVQIGTVYYSRKVYLHP